MEIKCSVFHIFWAASRRPRGLAARGLLKAALPLLPLRHRKVQMDSLMLTTIIHYSSRDSEGVWKAMVGYSDSLLSRLFRVTSMHWSVRFWLVDWNRKKIGEIKIWETPSPRSQKDLCKPSLGSSDGFISFITMHEKHIHLVIYIYIYLYLIFILYDYIHVYSIYLSI